MTERDHALELADYVVAANYGREEDGLHFGPTDAELVSKALHAYAAAIRNEPAVDHG